MIKKIYIYWQKMKYVPDKPYFFHIGLTTWPNLTPFENAGQNTFQILLLNDANKIGEH